MSDVRTVQDLIDEIRSDLDEAVDTGINETNFWTDAELVTWMNKGIRKVWQKAREAKENWFVRKLRSTDPKLTIYGRAYDPSQMQLVSDTREIKLPPDLFELRLMEPITSSSIDERDDSVQFYFGNLSDQSYRALSRSVGPAQGGRYECEIIFRTTGPVCTFVPQIALTDPMDVMIEYVAAPRKLAQTDTFENTGLNDFMLDAIQAYVVYRARKKEGASKELDTARADFGDTVDTVKGSAGPRQSRDPQTVDGYLEDQIY